MATTTTKLTPDEVRVLIRKHKLVGLTAAAKILGVAAPNVSRLRAQGRMPDGIPVEGSADVYLREEVVKLARALKRERGQRG